MDRTNDKVTTGAPEAVFPRCISYELKGKVLSLEKEHAADLFAHYQELSADGFRGEGHQGAAGSPRGLSDPVSPGLDRAQPALSHWA